MPIEIDLAGHTALVTGGGSGIGRETALRLGAAGADVAVLDLDESGAQETVEGVRALGRSAAALIADISDRDALAAALAGNPLPTPDIVVNNAFWAAPGPFLQADPADDEKTFRVIALGTISVTRATLPAMVTNGSGTIINVTSEAGKVGEAGMVAYSAAKAAVGGFTRSLAKEVGPSGVRVNAVSPGATKTPATTEILDTAALERLSRTYPLRRLGESTDIANAIVWLASPLASWVTGQILSVSGGYTTG